MKKLICLCLVLSLSCGCAAMAIGGAGAVGGYEYYKYREYWNNKYSAYVQDCQSHNIVPLDYKSWKRTQ